MRVGARLEILGLDSNLEGVCGFSHGAWYCGLEDAFGS